MFPYLPDYEIRQYEILHSKPINFVHQRARSRSPKACHSAGIVVLHSHRQGESAADSFANDGLPWVQPGTGDVVVLPWV